MHIFHASGAGFRQAVTPGLLLCATYGYPRLADNRLNHSAPLAMRQSMGSYLMQASQGNILIVDDELAVCELIRDELQELGLNCQMATESSQARQLIDNPSGDGPCFDVLIADVQMPNFTGLELLAFTKRRRPGCKVILITGDSKSQFVSQALFLGAFDYVEKPFKAGLLAEVVLKALNQDTKGCLLYDRAATAMEICDQSRKASLDSVTALARAVEAKDPYTRRHSEQVAHYAVNIAVALGLSGPELESVHIAALLHDIGKIGVPDYILTKPGPLTDEEFQYIRRHPALGADILASITMFGKEAQLVRYHHEMWNGKGYPSGLTGEESPFASRIIQVADSMDAMLMDRTYKKGYSAEKMIGELERCAGTQFDPQIAAVAIRWCRSNPDKLILAGKGIAFEPLMLPKAH
jgi:putative two-component system response regulator